MSAADDAVTSAARTISGTKITKATLTGTQVKDGTLAERDLARAVRRKLNAVRVPGPAGPQGPAVPGSPWAPGPSARRAPPTACSAGATSGASGGLQVDLLEPASANQIAVTICNVGAAAPVNVGTLALRYLSIDTA